MSDDNQALVNSAAQVVDTLNQMALFVNQQGQATVDQILHWHFAISVFWFGVGVVLVVLGAIWLARNIRLHETRADREREKIKTSLAAAKADLHECEKEVYRKLDDKNPAAFNADAYTDRLKTEQLVRNLERKLRNKDEENTGLVLSGASIIVVMMGLLFMVFNLTWVKIWLAPNMYILQYTVELFK